MVDDSFLIVRVPARFKSAVTTMATQVGMSSSDYVRRAIVTKLSLDNAPDVPPVPRSRRPNIEAAA